VLQTAVAMSRCLRHSATRDVLLYETEGVQRLCGFLASESAAVRAAADEVAVTAMDWDREHGRKSVWRVAQAARFRAHNREWCAAVAAGSVRAAAASGAGGPRHDDGEESGWSHGEDSMSPGGVGGHLGRRNHEAVALDAAGVLAAAGGSPYSDDGGEAEGWRDDESEAAGGAAAGLYWGHRH